MDFFHSAKSYCAHFVKAGDEHSIHSPFVFSFYSTIVRPNKTYYSFPKIEELRQGLYKDETLIKRVDFGAGKSTDCSEKISKIIKKVEKSPKLAQLLFRVANYYNPNTIIDLGTSFGLTTLYLAHAAPKAAVYTFEGCRETLKCAEKNFEALSTKNIYPIEGNIDETLELALQKIDQLDLVFFDANHRYQATMNYFTKCVEKAGENTIFIFDDIYWSKQMTEAWKEITNHSSVMISIDLFHLGLVFFRTNQPKQHFKLKI